MTGIDLTDHRDAQLGKDEGSTVYAHAFSGPRQPSSNELDDTSARIHPDQPTPSSSYALLEPEVHASPSQSPFGSPSGRSRHLSFPRMDASANGNTNVGMRHSNISDEFSLSGLGLTGLAAIPPAPGYASPTPGRSARQSHASQFIGTPLSPSGSTPSLSQFNGGDRPGSMALLLPDGGAPPWKLFMDEKEEDDYLHDPSSLGTLKGTGGKITWRALMNIGTIVALALAIIMLFAG